MQTAAHNLSDRRTRGATAHQAMQALIGVGLVEFYDTPAELPPEMMRLLAAIDPSDHQRYLRP